MTRLVAALALLVTAGCSATAPAAPRPTPPPQPGGPAPAVRRLTLAQYRNTLTDLFGPGLAFPPLDEEPRTGGFSTTGAALVATSFQASEQYLTAADLIARQVFADEARRYGVVGCVPRSVVDAPCLERFVDRLGRAAFRRPLLPEERSRILDMALTTARRRSDFWAGVRLATTAVLASPSFLYVVERGRSGRPGGRRLTSWEMATRLSLFLWTTSPDPLLLEAASRDELADDEGVRRHALRLLAAPRARAGMRDFFGELLHLEAVERVRSPKLEKQKQAIGRAMKEETLLVLEHNVFSERSDFRKLFATHDTFLDKDLATLYGVKVVDGGFTKIMLPPEGPRRGLLGHASFLAGTSAPDKTSPTARGKFVREVLLCEPVPAPPPGVDATLPPAEGEHRTMRERLEEHRLDLGCNKCHERVDTIGLAFERFDQYGVYRERENDAPIDPSGELDGVAFPDPSALGDLLARDPRVPACFVRNLYSYATGHIPGARDEPSLRDLHEVFRSSGHRVADLLLALATSEAFTHVFEGGRP